MKLASALLVDFSCVGVWMIHAPPVGKIWPGLSHKYSGPASRPAPEDITQPAESPLAPNQCSINSWNSAMPRCLLDLISKEKLNLDVLNHKSFQHVLSSCKHFFNDLHMNLKETLLRCLPIAFSYILISMRRYGLFSLGSDFPIWYLSNITLKFLRWEENFDGKAVFV